MYGSELISNTTSLETCVDILASDFIKAGYEIANKTQEAEIFTALYSFYNMAWSVHPLMVTCVEAPDEAVIALKAKFED